MANTLKFGNGEWYGKKDTILAYNDENNNYKPLPFDFSRGSSATRVNKDGLIETVGSGQPRIDFKDNTKGALLLEPTRSNLVTYSEDFSNAAWTKTDSIVSLNQDISPDGTNNATLYTSTSASNRLRTNFSHPTSVRTFSIWVKSYNNISVSGRLTFSGLNDLNFTTTNEWQRISTTRDISGDTFKCSLRLTNDNESILIYGAQLEEGSYATSYIPTSGGVVTRLADSSSQTPQDGVIGQTEGSIYSEFKCLDGISNIILWMRNPSGGSYGDMIKLEVRTNNVFQLEIKEANDPSANITSSALTVGDYYKVAVGYKQNDFVVYINGVQIGVDTSGSVPTCSEMYIGKYVDGGIRMGVVKDLKLYNTRLSNSELQALTQ
jgi:hypothetical protein